MGGDFNCPINPIIDKKGGLLTPRKLVVDSIECFREDLASNKDWNSVIWNNKEIRVSGSPVFYKNYFDSDIFYELTL